MRHLNAGKDKYSLNGRMNTIYGLGLPNSPAKRFGAFNLILLVNAALASTSASAQALELHAKFAACENCGCQTSQPLDVRLAPGRVFVKVHIEGWTPTNHTGYPAWVTYQARRRNNADWSGWSESLGGVSEQRIEWIRGKSSPEKPKPGDIVLFESEYQALLTPRTHPHASGPDVNLPCRDEEAIPWMEAKVEVLRTIADRLRDDAAALRRIEREQHGGV